MSTRYDRAIELCGILKRMPRTGWVRSKVNDPESVADHSMRTSYLGMLLCPKHLDKNKVIQMALIHDVAESIVTDITPYDGVSEEEKYKREDNAWTEISKSLDNDEMQILWREMEDGNTEEAKFVKELDKLEMLIQAEEYEKLQEDLNLSGFYTNYTNFFQFEETKEIFKAIQQRRSTKNI